MLGRIFPLFISVSTDAVKLDKPVSISLPGINLTGTDISGLLIPCDDRLCSGAAGRRADSDNLLHGTLSRLHILPGSEDLGSQMHQFVDMDALCLGILRPSCRQKFQRPHPPVAGITKPFYRVEGFRTSPLAGQPRINHRIAEFIRKAVGQQSGQAMKALSRQLRKPIHLPGKRHRNGCDLNSG